MNIKPSEPIKVTYGEHVFEIKLPKVKAMQVFAKRMANADESMSAMYEFCEAVGVPVNVLDMWDSKEMAQLFAQLNQEEKKS